MATTQQEQIEIDEMASYIRNQYQDQLQTALRELAQVQRQMTQAEHEVKRIEKHLEKIEAFCSQNKVAIKAHN